MSEESTWNPKLSDSKEPEEQDEALDETTLRVVAKAVVSEGERSVAIDQAQGSVINTGEIQGSVNIINVSLSQGSQESTLTTSDIGSAVNLVKLTQSLSSELSKRIAAELENAREVFREGKTQQSFQDVRRLLTSPNWQALDDSLRAMILRALANMVLSLKGKDGIDEAQAYINDASHFDPAATDQTALARIKLLRDGFAAGLAELGNAPTLDAFNLRVGILIETDQPDEALKVLASPPTGIALDAESQRLRAIALLLSCDLEGARGAISEPLKRMPRRQNVRLAAAVIDYHSSLSPLALQRQAVAYPHPVNPAMVKRDDESQGRLRSAAQQFAEVAAQMELGSNSQKEVETWQIACLANISDGMREAVDLCKSALLRDPMNFRVLAWVLYRGYEIDLAQSEDALKKLLGGPVNEEYRIHYVLALLGIYLKKEANESVLELLDAERALFESSGHADLWLYWRGQALVIGGQPDLALNQLAKIQQRKLRDNIQVLALCEIANRDGNWEPIIEYLEAAWEETKDPQFLIHLCEIKAQIGDWDYVADRAEEYCDRVGTASSAYFAISAARSAGRHQLCLHFLQKYEHLFPGDVLPVNLRRVRVYSKLNVKDITGALTEAERLVGEDDSVEDIFTLLDVLRAKGDLPGIEATVKRLRNRDLTALQCLQLAALIRVENSDLAREFWRRAKGEAQNDKSLAPVAVDLAFKLGLDREIGPLWERVHEVAQSEDESIQVFDIEQVLATMRHQQEALEKIQELYGSGEAPLALVVQRVKRPIVDLFNSLADENQSTSATKWHQRPRLFIRHGARLLPPSENFRNSSEWRLHLDGTALVLADHLGLLDKIEQTFKPLRISAKLPAALLAQRNELLDIQQSRLTICQAIVSLVEQGKLRSFKSGSPTTDLEMLQAVLEQSADDQGSKTSSGEEESELLNHERSKHAQASREGLSIQLGAERIAMLAEALRVDGFAVGLLPLRAYGNTQMAVLEIPDLLRSHVINCRAVVDSMQGQDRMSAPMFERALKGLGQEANPNVSPATPLVGAKLYLIDGAADVLAGAEVLDRACESFEVAVSEQCILEARTTLQEYSRRAAVAAQAQKLVQRISAGLEDGRYEFIPISDQRLKETADFEESESLDVAAMAELFRYESVNWDILWIDDRAINKHPFIGSAPIIGINEILMALRQREVIDKHEYYDLVLKLRVQNFRYVPIDEAEILYHLRKAPINNGVVTETENTAILRRYVASCLLDKDYLQPELTPEGARNPLGEHAFITNCLITFTGAIAACWTDDSATSEIARARADWIFDNLYVGLFGVLHLQERNHPGLLPFRLLARDIAGLLMKAITIGDPLHPERHSEKRSAYFGWLSERAITARFRSEPRILKSAGGEMARMFAAFSRVDEQQEDQRIVEKILLQKLFLDLPDDVQTEIELDEQTREWLGVTTFPAVVVGGFTFDSSEFVSAVEAALSGAHPTINPQGSETELRFALIEAEQGKAEGLNSSAIGVSNSDNQRIAVLGDPTLNVLSSEVEVRKATLRQFRDWFDGGDEEFEIEVDQIAKLTDPQERLERVHQLHSESGEVFYVSVEERLRQRKLSSENLTPVFARTLLKRLRLPPSFELDFSGLWEESAGKLLSEVGIERTIERCSLVPVPMPSAVIEALKMLPPNEQTEIIDRLFVQSASPVTRLHLANLALRVKGEAASAKAQQILSDLYDQELGEADFAAFAAILNFVNGEIETCRDSGEISPQLRLAITWAHASHVHNIFHAVGFSAADIAVIFQQHTRQLNARTMLREPALWDDCLHPHGINRTVFLTHGVSKMFAGIDREKLEEIGIVPMIEEEIILDVNGTKIPKVPLLHDSSLENDGLNSILGGDHATALALVLNDDEVELLSSGKLRQIVEQSLDQILVDRDLSAWVSIMFVLGDLPIYSDLREKFRAALKSIEIDAAFMASPGIAHAALSTAANQIRHWGDEELRASTGDKILAALTFEIERDTSPIDGTSATDGDTRERRLVDLVDAALKLSIVHGDLSTTGRNLADILGSISELWPDFPRRFDAMISDFLWELPVEVVVSWWPLCLKLRATTSQSW